MSSLVFLYAIFWTFLEGQVGHPFLDGIVGQPVQNLLQVTGSKTSLCLCSQVGTLTAGDGVLRKEIWGWRK
ncbi:MAG: hypothetical protein V7K94_31465 [Nostoc sp.]|uniref:hypothetical protein n=1 Tax=Nostoc sp. TaxID=1180 RepID=UPI002FFAE03F